MTARTRPARWPWALLLVVAVLLPLCAFSAWSGQCFDAAEGAGESFCTSGPSVGWPAAWLLTAVGAVAFVVAAIRLVRIARLED